MTIQIKIILKLKFATFIQLIIKPDKYDDERLWYFDKYINNNLDVIFSQGDGFL